MIDRVVRLVTGDAHFHRSSVSEEDLASSVTSVLLFCLVKWGEAHVAERQGVTLKVAGSNPAIPAKQIFLNHEVIRVLNEVHKR